MDKIKSPAKWTSDEQIECLKNLRQSPAAFLIGVSTATLKRNYPGDSKNPDGSYCGNKLVDEHVKKGGANPSGGQRQQSLVDSDGEISDAARKFRSEANILEMKEQLMAGDLVKAHDVRSYMSRIADAIRTLGEDLGRSPMPIAGADVQQRINDTIESVEWDLT